MGESAHGRPDPRATARFAHDLDALLGPAARIGLAVSGGPDSIALLLLAAAARPSLVEAATVDHGLRPESRSEADAVASLCAALDVPHRVLTVEWGEKPDSALQERARAHRYRLLSRWAVERGLDAILTGHHRDDQAETLLMRLARGAGVTGLAAMRPVARLPQLDVPLVRPLLAWSHADLESVCTAAGVRPAEDPGNTDDRFERARVRRSLGALDWLDAHAVALSASHLADADEALAWATGMEWDRAVDQTDDAIIYRPAVAPPEIRRRIVSRAISLLANEGSGSDLRGRELDRLLADLASDATTTLRGVLCTGGLEWRFRRAPQRRS